MSDELTPRMKREFKLSPARRAYNSGYYSSPEWKAYMKAYQKEYRQIHKERLRIEQRARRRTFRERTNAANRAYRRKNPDKQRAWAIQYKYGLTREQLAALGEHCQICGVLTTVGKTPKGVRTQRCVDHDHSTDAVRGLLCSRCNFAVGLLDESPDRFRAAAAYLERVEKKESAA